jgi:hypothetical protein
MTVCENDGLGTRCGQVNLFHEVLARTHSLLPGFFGFYGDMLQLRNRNTTQKRFFSY